MCIRDSINNCTNKPGTMLGKLTISNSLVFGLGTVNCANIVINGGSVDLDVPVNTVVKDSNGNELKKVTLTLSEKKDVYKRQVENGAAEGNRAIRRPRTDAIGRPHCGRAYFGGNDITAKFIIRKCG